MLLDSRKKTSFAYLPVLVGLFTASFLVANVLNCKIIRVGPLPTTGSLILFPWLALFGEGLTEVYGHAIYATPIEENKSRGFTNWLSGMVRIAQMARKAKSAISTINCSRPHTNRAATVSRRAANDASLIF